MTRAQAIARGMEQYNIEKKSEALKHVLLKTCDNYSRTRGKVNSSVGYLLGVGASSQDDKVCSTLAKIRKTQRREQGATRDSTTHL